MRIQMFAALVMSMFSGAWAHADYVVCVRADSTFALAYKPQSMTFEFVRLNGVHVGEAESVKIVGEPQQVNPRSEYTAVFQYRLENGLTVKATWDAGQSEVLRDIRTRVLKMEILSAVGESVETLSKCRWVTE